MEKQGSSAIREMTSLIDGFVERTYPCATDEDEYEIRRETAVLFGKIMELSGTRGIACIMADMAYGTMRDMDGAASDVARDYLVELIELTGISPEEVGEDEKKEASLAVYGDPDAFVF